MERGSAPRWIPLEDALARVAPSLRSRILRGIESGRVRSRNQRGVRLVAADDLESSAHLVSGDRDDGVTEDEVEALRDPGGAPESPPPRPRSRRARRPRREARPDDSVLEGVQSELASLHRDFDSLRREIRESDRGEVETVHAQILPSDPLEARLDLTPSPPPRTRRARGAVPRMLVGFVIVALSILTGVFILLVL